MVASNGRHLVASGSDQYVGIRDLLQIQVADAAHVVAHFT